MKKLIIALVLGLGLTGFAQETPSPQNKANSEKLTPQQRQEKHLAYLTKELTLDAKQQEAVGKILAEKSAKAKELKARKATGEKMTDQERDAFRSKMQVEKADTEAKMKAILSTDQYKKWLTIREENREKMKERGMGKMTTEQHQQKHLAHLTKELTLDTKQQEAVGKILAEKSAKAQELKAKKQERNSKGEKMTPEEKTTFKNKMQAEKADTEARMKAILTADQYKKWLAMREENKERVRQGMGNGGDHNRDGK